MIGSALTRVGAGFPSNFSGTLSGGDILRNLMLVYFFSMSSTRESERFLSF